MNYSYCMVDMKNSSIICLIFLVFSGGFSGRTVLLGLLFYFVLNFSNRVFNFVENDRGMLERKKGLFDFLFLGEARAFRKKMVGAILERPYPVKK